MKLISFINNNKQWLFSGIGVVILMTIINFIFSSDPEITNKIYMQNESKIEIPVKESKKNTPPIYHDFELNDGSYIFSSKEQYRAIELYKEVYTISPNLVSEIENTILEQKKILASLGITQKELTLEETEKLKQLKINNRIFITLSKQIKKLLALHQENIKALVGTVTNETP